METLLEHSRPEKEGGRLRIAPTEVQTNDKLRQEIDKFLCHENEKVSENETQEEDSPFNWRVALQSINEGLDALFQYNLGNVLKVINICVTLMIGVNAMLLYSELSKSNYHFTLIPSVITGFLVLAVSFLFLLNIWIAALPAEALLKKKPVEHSN